jgi:DNA-binding transcriptional ArsR family regulator
VKREDHSVEKQSATSEAEEMQAHAADAAGNESRLMILCTLAEGERSVGELNEIIPLSQSALSQQLARLRREGLVKTRRESQVIHYSLCDGPADRVINVLHDIFCGTGGPAGTKDKH